MRNDTGLAIIVEIEARTKARNLRVPPKANTRGNKYIAAKYAEQQNSQFDRMDESEMMQNDSLSQVLIT